MSDIYWNKELSDKDNCFALALAHFVYETPPIGVHTWNEDKVENWAEEHAWQPFEYWSGKDIVEQVHVLARDFQAVADLRKVHNDQT
tara:strand:+ start:76 stop:336 length:261 start_codon:yes stop_codon:yes gene_type:complete